MNTIFYTLLGYVWQYITNPRAIMALSFFVMIIAMKNTVSDRVFWILLSIYIFVLIVWGCYESFVYYKNKNKSQDLEKALTSEYPANLIKQNHKHDVAKIQQQMKESIQLLRKSKLGNYRGKPALYELPWYMVIGNPAAGKSSAIYHSGLNFPFEESHAKSISSALSGTRSCDWFFSTDGILLDTAGRYSVYAEDHPEWLSFLSILKKNRPKAPVNGLIMIVSVAELISQSPEKTIQLAKNLRGRIQDLTERLEVTAPIYIIFSKMDLIAGFTEFFDCYDKDEFDQVWGAKLPFEEN